MVQFVYRQVRWECPGKSGRIGMSWDAVWKSPANAQMWRGMEVRSVCIYMAPETIERRVNLLTTREEAWYIISVCLYICLFVCQTITFESLDVGSLYLHIRYISREYGPSSYMKVIGSRSRSQLTGAKRLRIPIPAMQNFDWQQLRFYKTKAMKFGCSTRFSAMMDWLVWPPFLSRDRKWPPITKWTYSRVGGLK